MISARRRSPDRDLAEIADVRDSLLLVDDEVIDDVEIFGPRLSREVLRRVPIVPAIVHVHVEIGASELPRTRRAGRWLRVSRDRSFCRRGQLHRRRHGK